DAPNAANRNEENVNQYILPDPLIFESGEKVMTTADWWKGRRPEIVEDFEREIYGRLPAQIPAVKWKTVYIKDTIVGNQAIKEKMLLGVVDNSLYPDIQVEIEVLMATPQAIREAVPLVLHFGFIHSPFRNNSVSPIGLGSSSEPDWREQLIMRGWGYATIVPSSIQADHGAGLRTGIIGLTNLGQSRKPEDWGALRAWAWGASRAIDYFEGDRDVDPDRIAIEGLSRYGKAAIVTMAFEPRISLGFIGSAGAGGSKILRRVFGEQVENLAGVGEYHWFCGNFIKYGSSLTPDDLPVDAHQLVALCAPRPIFISSGSPQVEGQWVDAKGMFLSGVHAGPVYRLLGRNDLGTSDFPVIGTPLIEGEIAFRQHAGGHSTGPNWSTWIAWACRYWGHCRYF
ncbi:MAG: acetylxylan esterase, partial [Saprospiraceae bacterium]|nr:acetylxylan esterase [Saprospiraceae bacterium]